MTTDEVQAYLDDALDGDAQRAFESRLAADPALRAEIDDHRRIEGSLRRRFTPPGEETLARVLDRARDDAAAAPLPFRRRPAATAVRLAAAVLFALLGAWLMITALRPEVPRSPYAPREHQGPRALYAAELRDGFRPDWVCEEAVFARVFRDRHGAPLRFDAPADDAIAATGLAYANALSPRTTCVLLDAAGAPVLVLVDRLDRDPDLETGQRDGLSLFRRELGPLVLYEVTPLDEPRALPRFSIPEETAP